MGGAAMSGRRPWWHRLRAGLQASSPRQGGRRALTQREPRRQSTPTLTRLALNKAHLSQSSRGAPAQYGLQALIGNEQKLKSIKAKYENVNIGSARPTPLPNSIHVCPKT